MTIGGVPFYVDEDCREDLIPKGTRAVVKLQKGLRNLDKFETIPCSDSNFFVEEVKKVRKQNEAQKRTKLSSLFSQRQINFDFVPRDFSKPPSKAKSRFF